MRQFSRRIFAMSLSILCVSALSAEPIGLVLSGGGAKGAYEVGVWKAMVEVGLARDVRAISGTSIGAVNGSLFAAVKDPSKVASFWESRAAELLGPFVNCIGRNLQAGLDVVAEDLRRREMAIAEGKQRLAAQRGISVDDLLPDEIEGVVKDADVRFAFALARRPAEIRGDALGVKPVDAMTYRKLLSEKIPEVWPEDAPRVYVTVLEKVARKTRTFLLNAEPYDRRLDAIAASSAYPKLFNPVVIDGVVYIDGGWRGGDNTPLRPILDNHPEIKTIVVVYLDDKERLRKNRSLKYDLRGKNIIEIVPSLDSHGLLGTLDANRTTVEKLIRLGYDDAVKILSKLK